MRRTVTALLLAALAAAAGLPARAEETVQGSTPSETARLLEESAKSREEAARIWEGIGNRPRAAGLWAEAAGAWERAARAWEEAGDAARSRTAMERFFQAVAARDRSEIVLESLDPDAAVRVGETAAVRVRAADREGVPAPDVDVLFEIADRPRGDRSATVLPESTETDSDGVATAVFTAGPAAGAYRVLARVPDLARAPVVASIRARAGDAAVLGLHGGNEQVVKVNRQALAPLAARVTDASGNPIEGVAVRFALVAAPQGAMGASLSAEEATTGSEGVASVVFTAGNVGGRYSVLVEAGDLRGSPSRFDVTAVQTIPTVTIRSIRVEGAADTAPVVAGMDLRPGKTYLLVELGRALRGEVRRIFATGRYRDAAVDIEEREGGEASLTFRVEENPRIASIAFYGNRRVADGDLLPELGIAEGSYLSPASLARAEAAVLKKYEEKGYVFATVRAETEPALAGRVGVLFRVEEQQRVKIHRLVLEGNEAVSATRLNWWMKTSRGGIYRREEFEEDRQRIIGEYFNRGYLMARVDDPVIAYDERRRMIVTVRIHEGKRFRLGRIEYAGNSVVPSEALAAEMRLAEGEIFDREQFAKSLQKMTEMYRRLGYVDVKIDPQSDLDPEAGRADFVMRIDEGLIYRLENIVIEGNVKTRDDVILREVRVKAGEILDGEKVEQSRRNLANLQYFDKVEFELQPGTEAGMKVLKILVAEGRTGSIQGGAGYSNVDGLVGFVQISKKNFDPWDFWSFTGGGQELSVAAELGGKKNSYNVSWTEPWWRGHPISLGLDAFRIFQDREDFQWNRSGGNLRLGWRRSDFDLVSLRYRYEAYRVSQIGVNAPQDIKDEARGRPSFDRTTASLTPGYLRDTRDNTRFPHEGYRFSYSGEFASTWLGGNVDFVRPTFTQSVYRRAPWANRHILAARAEYATISQFLEVLEIPTVEQYIRGGSNDIRGYPERSVQIYDAQGVLMGPGMSSFFFNLEYRLPLDDEDRMSLVAFFDGGNVFESDWAFGDLVYGLGGGIRFESPFGPIRLDVARGLDFPNKGQTEVHFSIGQTF